MSVAVGEYYSRVLMATNISLHEQINRYIAKHYKDEREKLEVVNFYFHSSPMGADFDYYIVLFRRVSDGEIGF